MADCLCECGAAVTTRKSKLNSGRKTCCRHCSNLAQSIQSTKRYPSSGMSPRLDLTGKTFNRLTVIEFAGKRGKKPFWSCRCICGTVREICRGDIVTGHTKSCGCLAREACPPPQSAANAPCSKHGHATRGKISRTYHSWQAMKARCTNHRNHKYPLYGARGITVCERWLRSFENFLADMGERPEGHTLDRFPNNEGNYEPGNCRWATVTEQNRNLSKRKVKSFPASLVAQ